MDLTSCDRERAILVGPHEAPPLAGEQGLALAHLILGSCCLWHGPQSQCVMGSCWTS